MEPIFDPGCVGTCTHWITLPGTQAHASASSPLTRAAAADDSITEVTFNVSTRDPNAVITYNGATYKDTSL
jgi:hypothetical protein